MYRKDDMGMRRRVLLTGLLVLALCAFFAWATGSAMAGQITRTDNTIQGEPGQLPVLAPVLPAPPSDFKPLQASNEELKQYGLPQRPSDPADLAKWQDLMSHAKSYVAPVQTPSTTTHGLVRTTYSRTWAGYVVKRSDTSLPLITEASAYWTQPAYSGNSADPSFWTGIGGYSGSGYLAQAGADSGSVWAGGPTRYCFWVEDYPNGTVWETRPAVRAGDRLYVAVDYYSGVSYCFLENLTTGQYTTVDLRTPYYDGTSADFIHEAVGGAYANWGSTTFTGCEVNGNVDLSGCPYSKSIMTSNGSSSGTVKASPSNVSNSSFTVTSR